MIPGYPCYRQPWYKRWPREFKRWLVSRIKWWLRKEPEIPPLTKFSFPIVKNPGRWPSLTDLDWSVQPMTAEVGGIKWEYRKTTWWDKLKRKFDRRKRIDGCF